MGIESSHPRWSIMVCATAFFLGLIGVCSVAAQEDPYLRSQKGELLVEVHFEGDYLELERFQGRLEATVVRLDKPHLYLLVDRSQLPTLRKEGFQPAIVDPGQFFTQLVRIDLVTHAVVAHVRKLGGQLVQREEAYAVFRVSRQQLAQFKEHEIVFREIEEGELRPRFVEIGAHTEEEVTQIVAVGVDIFEWRNGVILGRAFDEQIETLVALGLEVEVVRPPQWGPD